MAVEAILSGTVPQVGSGLLGRAAFAARPSLTPIPTAENGVSVTLDHLAVAAAGRLAGQAAGLDRGRANAATAMSLLEVADTGLEAIEAKLTRMRVLAAQAASVKLEASDPTPPATSTLERVILHQEFAQLRAEIDTVVDDTTFNGLQVLKGSGGSGTFSAAFNVGGDSQSHDVITVSIEAATAANLSSGLAGADLSTVAGASAALTEVNAALDKVDDIQAGVRGDAVRLHAAATGAGRRAIEAESESDERMSTRIAVDFARVVGDRVLDDNGVSALAHNSEMLRDLLAVLELPEVETPAPSTASTAAEPAAGPQSAASAAQSAAGAFASGGSGRDTGSGDTGSGDTGSKVDVSA